MSTLKVNKIQHISASNKGIIVDDKGTVGITTHELGTDIVGAASSLVGLYIGDGSLLFSSALSRSGGYYISTDINALNAGTGNNFESVAGSLQDAARAVLPEFFASTIASGANALSGFLGVRGNLNMNSLAGLTEGKVFNPYVEQIFSQMNFRNHSFAFKMFARNYKEAQEIKKIIQYVNP